MTLGKCLPLPGPQFPRPRAGLLAGPQSVLRSLGLARWTQNPQSVKGADLTHPFLSSLGSYISSLWYVGVLSNTS